MRHLISLVIREYKSQWDSILSPFDCQTLRSCVVASVGENIDHCGLFCAAGKSVNGCSPFGKQFGVILQSCYVRLLCDLAFLLLGVKYCEKLIHVGTRRGVLRMFLVALLVITKIWKPKCSSAGGRVRTLWPCDWAVTWQQRECTTSPRNDMSESSLSKVEL